MNWWQSALAFLGLPAGAQDGDNLRTGKVTTERTTDSRAGTEGAALGLSATWACVNFWAGNIASLPITVYRKGPLGIGIEARDHPLFVLLHDSPNYDQSAFDFWEFMVACLELRGNAYAEIIRRDNGSILALSPIRPDAVTARRVPTGGLEYRWYDGGAEVRMPQERVLHIRGFGGGPLGGVSPLQVCRNTFGTAIDADAAARSMFRNGIRSSGVLSSDGPEKLTPQQMADAQTLIEEKYAGAVNAGRPLLLNGLKWQAITISPADAEMLESRHFSVADICRVFEVDPHLVGHTAGNTQLGSSIEDQTLSLLKFKMRKRLKRIESALEKQLLTPADRAAGISIKFNLEAFLRADSEGRARFYELMKPFMTVNEVRALEGLSPVPGGDVILAQMQDVPLSRTLEPRRIGNDRQLPRR